MKLAGVAGTVAGLPVKGGFVSLETADAALLLGATAGLVKALALTGAGALGIALVYAIAHEERVRRDTQIAVASLCKVRGGNREFVGISTDGTLDFICDGQSFSVPLTHISEIREVWESGLYGSEFCGHAVELVDRSVYRNAQIQTRKLTFFSCAGQQEILFRTCNTLPRGLFLILLPPYIWFGPKRPGNPLVIEGASWRDVEGLRGRLSFVLEHNREAVITALGEGVVSKYFHFKGE